jgi:hypothetical protein
MRKLIGTMIVLAITVSMSSCVEYVQEPSIVSGSLFLKGVSLSPKSFQSQDFIDFFEKAAQAGEIITWAGDWDELGRDNGGPKVVTELASTYDYIPLVEVQFFTQSTGKLLRPLNEETKHIYLTSAVTFVQTYSPMYIGFGIEVNVLYQKSPDDFDDFVVFYHEVYDAVKKASPTTKVFTVFQLERMKGLNGGLFGGTNDLDEAHWFLLDRFPSDLVAFTTYPGLIYKTPSEIPADYYTEINHYTQKPIAFLEIGWHTDFSPPGWESSEAEQAAFVETFFRLTNELDMELAIWSFLFDPDIFEPFKSMGLYSTDGHAKRAWDIWISSEKKIDYLDIRPF